MRIEHARGYCTWLRLRQLALDDPEAAISQGQTACRLAGEGVKPRLYAVIGSALRRSAELDAAYVMLSKGIEGCKRLQDTWGLADATQRLALVIFDLGRWEKALELAQQASGLFAGIGDEAGVGRTLVTRGQLYGHVENFESAERCLRQALKKLPQCEANNRLAALINLARTHLDRKHMPSALKWARAAASTRGRVAQSALMACRQTQGALELELGHPELAERSFEICRNFYLEQRNFLSAAFVTLYYCQALVARGKFHAARDLARSSISLVGHLKSSRAAAGLVAALAREAASGDLKQGFLEALRKRMVDYYGARLAGPISNFNR